MEQLSETKSSVLIMLGKKKRVPCLMTVEVEMYTEHQDSIAWAASSFGKCKIRSNGQVSSPPHSLLLAESPSKQSFLSWEREKWMLITEAPVSVPWHKAMQFFPQIHLHGPVATTGASACWHLRAGFSQILGVQPVPKRTPPGVALSDV